MEWMWVKANEKSLAQFVSDRAVEILPRPSIDRFDLVQTREGRLHLVESIYNQLLTQDIRYAYEKYHPEAERQRIRTPAEVLSRTGEGTCLDLALLFCGLCFGYDLLPLLVVVKGHAFVAVSLSHQRREWNSYARERTLFNSTELFHGDDNQVVLCDLIDDGAYVAVECTGFARTPLNLEGSMPETIGRTPTGKLTFDRAMAAGREQLENADRPFLFAIDIAVAHYSWKIEPLTEQSQPTLKLDTFEGSLGSNNRSKSPEEIEREQLTEEYRLLEAQYEAESEAARLTIDPASRIKHTEKAKKLLKQMKEIYIQLNS